jgi:hypothetical protein
MVKVIIFLINMNFIIHIEGKWVIQVTDYGNLIII